MREVSIRKLGARQACRQEIETNEESEEQDCLLLMQALGIFYRASYAKSFQTQNIIHRALGRDLASSIIHSSMFAHPHSLNERDVPMISRVLTRVQSDPLRQVGARHSPPSDLSVPGPIPNDTAAIIARDMAIKLKRDSLSLNNPAPRGYM